MARNEILTIAANTWTQLTNTDATAITFQVRRGKVEIVGTVGAVAPVSFAAGLLYEAGQGEAGITMADLAPGIAATRVYAYSAGEAAQVMVSHA